MGLSVGDNNASITSTENIRFYTGATAGNMIYDGQGGVNAMTLESGGNVIVNNKFYQNSVGRICNSGIVGGDASFYIDYTVATQSSLKVTAVFNHYGYITSFGCSRFSLVAIGPAFTTVDISNVETGNGGSWSISRIDSTTLRVSKNAGTYA